jgi:hypothetical protein
MYAISYEARRVNLIPFQADIGRTDLQGKRILLGDGTTLMKVHQ